MQILDLAVTVESVCFGSGCFNGVELDGSQFGVCWFCVMGFVALGLMAAGLAVVDLVAAGLLTVILAVKGLVFGSVHWVLEGLISFEMVPPQSSLGTLFLGTSLNATFTRMSLEKVAPTGLKHQECEHGRGGKKSPIHYMPERDPQEALDLKPESIKCAFSNGSETQVTVWSGHSTSEIFLLHVNKAFSATTAWVYFPSMVMPQRHMSQIDRCSRLFYLD